MKRALKFPCPTCSAPIEGPCRSVGRLQEGGTEMQSVHVARRRLASIALFGTSERRNADRIDGYDRDDIPGGGDR